MAKGRVMLYHGPASTREERRGRKRNDLTLLATNPWLGIASVGGYAFKQVRREGRVSAYFTSEIQS